MSDETQGLASPPAEGEQPVDLDAAVTQPEQAEQTEGDQTEGEEPAEDAGEKPEGEKPERKRLSGAEKAKRRQTFLLNQLAEKDRLLAELQARNSSEQSDADKPPKEEDFNGDWQAFQDAKAAHAARQAVRDEFRRDADSKRSAAQQAELRERVVDHEERCDEAREVIKDFDQVVSKVTGVSEPLAWEVLHSEKSALLQYHLAQNPETFNRLNALHGPALAREIGRLEATLKMPEAKKQTKAPAPLGRLSGGAAAPFNAEKASMSEYAKEFERRMKAGG